MPAQSTAGGGPHGNVTDDTRRRTKKGGARAPVDRIEPRPLSALVPYASNPRLHSDEQIEQIAASMREFGQAQLVVVDEEGEIIAGHGRVLAANRLGWKKLLVGVAAGWSEAQKRGYRVADNQLALMSAWDDQLLSQELGQLRDLGFELPLLGFTDEGLKVILDGWSSDIDVLSHGAHTDGIHTRLMVLVKQEEAERARSVIEAALSKAKISAEVR